MRQTIGNKITGDKFTGNLSIEFIIMECKQVFWVGLKCFFWYCKLFGLCPLHYDSQKNAFNWSTLEIIYSMFIWAMFSYFFTTSGITTLSHLNPLVVVVFFYMTMVTATITFVVILLNVRKMTVLMNESKDLIEELHPFCRQISNQQSCRAAISFIFKTVVTSVIAQFGSIYCCIILCQAEINEVNYFLVFIVSIAHCLEVVVPNMFYVFILCVSIAYSQLNAEIEDVLRLANFYEKYRNDSNANKLFEKLGAHLNDIASLHGKLTALTIKVNRVFSLQLLILIGDIITVLLIEVNR